MIIYSYLLLSCQSNSEVSDYPSFVKELENKGVLISETYKNERLVGLKLFLKDDVRSDQSIPDFLNELEDLSCLDVKGNKEAKIILPNNLNPLINLEKVRLLDGVHIQEESLSSLPNINYLLIRGFENSQDTIFGNLGIDTLHLMHKDSQKELSKVPSFRNMENVEYLIIDRVKDEFSSIKDLKGVRVIDSKFVGKFYSGIEQIKNIDVLRVRINCLDHLSFPESAIDLSINKLIIQSPNYVNCDTKKCQISTLARLKELELVNLRKKRKGKLNRLQYLPEDFYKLKNIVRLNLIHLDSLELTSSIKSLNNLKHLYISGLIKMNQLPDELGELKNLEYFNIEHTSISQLPKSFKNLKQLKSVKIAYNYDLILDATLFQSLEYSLEEIEVIETKLNSFPNYLVDAPNLKSISFVETGLTEKDIPQGLIERKKKDPRLSLYCGENQY